MLGHSQTKGRATGSPNLSLHHRATSRLHLVFALVQIARLKGDRERDLPEELRQRIAERIRCLPGGGRGARLVTEVVPLEAQERARVLDESLPAGLVIRGD